MRKPHVPVIDAGLVGEAIAWRLAPQASVTVIEATAPAWQASGKSFGRINASFFHDARHHALRAKAIAAHRRLDALIESDSRWTGTLWRKETGAAFDRCRNRMRRLLPRPSRVWPRRQTAACSSPAKGRSMRQG